MASQNKTVTRQTVLGSPATQREIGGGGGGRYCIVWFATEEPPQAVVGDFWLQL